MKHISHILVHPECKEGEVFFTNADSPTFELIPFTSKRKGLFALDGELKKLDIEGWFPVFVNKEELDRANNLYFSRLWFRIVHDVLCK